MIIDGLDVVQTCGACPEQYSVYDKDKSIVGYLRLRHGYFSARNPNSSGDVVYEAMPIGDGIFDSEEERAEHITKAITEIRKKMQLIAQEVNHE